MSFICSAACNCATSVLTCSCMKAGIWQLLCNGELLPSTSFGDAIAWRVVVGVINVFLTPVLLVAWALKIYVLPCFDTFVSGFICKVFFAIPGASCFLYKDSDFPCTDENAGMKTSWMRLSEMTFTDKTNQKKFKPTRLFSSISPDDIAQGALGDCWLLAGLATLAERPHLVQNCFLTRSFSPRGKYTLRLYDSKAKRFRNVTIDDHIPIDDAGEPRFSKIKGNEMYPLLIEKAFAKMRGGYKKLDGGYTLDAMQTITGFSGGFFTAKDLKGADPHFFTKLRRLFDSGCILSCGSKGKDETLERGRESVQGSIVGGHAYSILGMYEPLLTGEKVQLLKLRNPWGGFEWQGAWSDKSSKWDEYPGVRVELGRPADVDDGTFFIPYKDWAALFDQVDVLYPSTDVSQLHINVHEECGVACGPLLGCALGLGRFWCMCQGVYSLWRARSSEEAKHDLTLSVV